MGSGPSFAFIRPLIWCDCTGDNQRKIVVHQMNFDCIQILGLHVLKIPLLGVYITSLQSLKQSVTS